MMNIILEALRDEFLTRTPLDGLPDGVWKRASALNTWGTNAIEGNTLTWSDVEKLLLQQKSVANRPIKDVLETIQHEAAFRRLLALRTKLISLVLVQDLHDAVFRGVKEGSGQWRRVNVRIAGSSFALPRMEKVVPMMEEWAREYSRRDREGDPVFDLGAWMHNEFESIHPFSDGNGRVGRLLLNLHFLKHNWPPVHVLPQDRRRYLSCMESANDGDLSRLVEFVRVLMAHSLLDLLDQVGTREDELKQLKSFSRKSGYSAQYLSLRAGQGQLPALMVRGDWLSSQRAIDLYTRTLGRARPSRKASE
jgi:Fic family protein